VLWAAFNRRMFRTSRIACYRCFCFCINAGVPPHLEEVFLDFPFFVIADVPPRGVSTPGDQK